jgi:Fe-S cluster assembly protein SufD
MTQTHSLEQYHQDFSALERGLNGQSSSPAHAVRRRALERFFELGFPGTENEEWRFTNVAPIAAGVFPRAAAAVPITRNDITPFLLPEIEPITLVFVNGFFSSELSGADHLPEGVHVEPLSGTLARNHHALPGNFGSLVPSETNGFTALNTAFLWDGACIAIAEKVELEQTVHLLFLSTGRKDPFASYPRTLVTVGAHARLSLVETYAGLGDGVYFTNAVTELLAGEGATVEHDKLQLEGASSFHIGTSAIHLGRSAVVTSNTINLGGRLVRNTVTATLAGEGGECTLNGLSVAGAGQLVDNHTAIDHAVPHCTSHELYKAILHGNARGVFNGKIFVRKDAQKTDAKQTNKTLLLSDDATIDTKPQLEIFADDVKCTHGATVGQLDEDQIFYLRARGIGEQQARSMLTSAFADDVIDRVHVSSLRERLHEIVHRQEGLGLHE